MRPQNRVEDSRKGGEHEVIEGQREGQWEGVCEREGEKERESCQYL